MTAGRPSDRTRLGGTAHPAFQAVADRVAELGEDPDFGAQLCVLVDGRPVVDLWCGPGLGPDSLFPVFSCSKGAAAICIAMLVDQGLLDLDATVAHYWPEFAAAGKASVTVRQLLSHQAGLVDVDGGLDWPELLDDGLGAERLAEQRPFWRPGSAQGYHALTLGVLMGELARRVTGRPLQEYFEHEVRAPRDLDVYLGLPPALDDRVLAVEPMRPTADEAAAIARDRRRPDSLELLPYARTGWSTGGRFAMADSRAGRAAGMPAAGGFASARGLAHLYSEAVTGIAGPRLFGVDAELQVAQIQTARTDLVLGVPMRFAIGFQKPDPTRPFGSYRAFGHDGACGALAFADPLHGLAFGYVPRRMPYPGGADPRALELAALAGEAARRSRGPGPRRGPAEGSPASAAERP